MKRPAAARADLLLNIDNLFDPLEMRGQGAAVGFTGLIAAGTRRNSISGSTGMSKGDLDILQSQLELIGIELLRPATETMPHEGVDNRLKALDLGVRLALGNAQLCQPGLRCGPLLRQHPGLLQDERAKRVDVFWQVRLHEHGNNESVRQSPVNRQFAGPAVDGRHEPGASPIPPEARLAGRRKDASRRPGCQAT